MFLSFFVFSILLVSCTGNSVTVAFETNGGNEINDIVYNFEGDFNLPKAPTKEGFDFLGWYVDENFEVVFSITYLIGKDQVTLYAKWGLLAYAFSASSESSQMGSIESNVENGLLNPNQVVLLTAIPNEGYKFKGWYDGDTILSTNLSYSLPMPSRNLNVIAKFEVILLNYKLTLVYDEITTEEFMIPTGTIIDFSTLNYQIIDKTKVENWYQDELLLSVVNHHQMNENITLFAKRSDLAYVKYYMPGQIEVKDYSVFYDGYRYILDVNGTLYKNYQSVYNMELDQYDKYYMPLNFELNLGLNEAIERVIYFGHDVQIYQTTKQRIISMGDNSNFKLGSIHDMIGNYFDITSKFNLAPEDYIEYVFPTETYLVVITKNKEVFTWGTFYNNNMSFPIINPLRITNHFSLDSDEYFLPQHYEGSGLIHTNKTIYAPIVDMNNIFNKNFDFSEKAYMKLSDSINTDGLIYSVMIPNYVFFGIYDNGKILYKVNPIHNQDDIYKLAFELNENEKIESFILDYLVATTSSGRILRLNANDFTSNDVTNLIFENDEFIIEYFLVKNYHYVFVTNKGRILHVNEITEIYDITDKMSELNLSYFDFVKSGSHYILTKNGKTYNINQENVNLMEEFGYIPVIKTYSKNIFISLEEVQDENYNHVGWSSISDFYDGDIQLVGDMELLPEFRTPISNPVEIRYSNYLNYSTNIYLKEGQKIDKSKFDMEIPYGYEIDQIYYKSQPLEPGFLITINQDYIEHGFDITLKELEIFKVKVFYFDENKEIVYQDLFFIADGKHFLSYGYINYFTDYFVSSAYSNIDKSENFSLFQPINKDTEIYIELIMKPKYTITFVFEYFDDVTISKVNFTYYYFNDIYMLFNQLSYESYQIEGFYLTSDYQNRIVYIYLIEDITIYVKVNKLADFAITFLDDDLTNIYQYVYKLPYENKTYETLFHVIYAPYGYEIIGLYDDVLLTNKVELSNLINIEKLNLYVKVELIPLITLELHIYDRYTNEFIETIYHKQFTNSYFSFYDLYHKYYYNSIIFYDFDRTNSYNYDNLSENQTLYLFVQERPKVFLTIIDVDGIVDDIVLDFATNTYVHFYEIYAILSEQIDQDFNLNLYYNSNLTGYYYGVPINFDTTLYAKYRFIVYHEITVVFDGDEFENTIIHGMQDNYFSFFSIVDYLANSYGYNHDSISIKLFADQNYSDRIYQFLITEPVTVYAKVEILNQIDLTFVFVEQGVTHFIDNVYSNYYIDQNIVNMFENILELHISKYKIKIYLDQDLTEEVQYHEPKVDTTYYYVITLKNLIQVTYNFVQYDTIYTLNIYEDDYINYASQIEFLIRSNLGLDYFSFFIYKDQDFIEQIYYDDFIKTLYAYVKVEEYYKWQVTLINVTDNITKTGHVFSIDYLTEFNLFYSYFHLYNLEYYQCRVTIAYDENFLELYQYGHTYPYMTLYLKYEVLNYSKIDFILNEDTYTVYVDQLTFIDSKFILEYFGFYQYNYYSVSIHYDIDKNLEFTPSYITEDETLYIEILELKTYNVKFRIVQENSYSYITFFEIAENQVITYDFFKDLIPYYFVITDIFDPEMILLPSGFTIDLDSIDKIYTIWINELDTKLIYIKYIDEHEQIIMEYYTQLLTGEKFSYSSPIGNPYGYEIVGIFLDSEFTISFNQDTIVTEDFSVFVKVQSTTVE
jgi:uncharacterized repeat protein (TIGR02543 family)